MPKLSQMDRAIKDLEDRKAVILARAHAEVAGLDAAIQALKAQTQTRRKTKVEARS